MADRARLQQKMAEEREKVTALRNDLEVATNLDIPILAQILRELVFTDPRERQLLLNALLGPCNLEQQHELLVSLANTI